MRIISTAEIVYNTQLLCILCALGLLIMWGLKFNGYYGICSIAVGVVFTTVTFFEHKRKQP